MDLITMNEDFFSLEPHDQKEKKRESLKDCNFPIQV